MLARGMLARWAAHQNASVLFRHCDSIIIDKRLSWLNPYKGCREMATTQNIKLFKVYQEVSACYFTPHFVAMIT